MTYKHCMTRAHIEVWHEQVLPDEPVPVRFVTVLRGSLLPILVWLGVAAFVFFIYSPVVAVIEGGLFLIFFLLSFNRRRGSHSRMCSLYGAVGGVLNKSMAGF